MNILISKYKPITINVRQKRNKNQTDYYKRGKHTYLDLLYRLSHLFTSDDR